MQRDLLSLYLVTDRDMCRSMSLEEAVNDAILGGVTLVQLREKGVSFDDFVERARRMKAVCDCYGVPLIINDSVDVAIAVGAAGVHLGASDGDISEARARLGRDKIIGASARDMKAALMAQAAGADYLGVGAVFGTSTKADAKAISPETVREIASGVNIPVVAIGGVNESNIDRLGGSGIAGVAVVSAILRADSIRDASRKLRARVRDLG